MRIISKLSIIIFHLKKIYRDREKLLLLELTAPREKSFNFRILVLLVV